MCGAHAATAAEPASGSRFIFKIVSPARRRRQLVAVASAEYNNAAVCGSNYLHPLLSESERGGAHTAIKSIFVIMQCAQLFEPSRSLARCGNGEIITIMNAGQTSCMRAAREMLALCAAAAAGSVRMYVLNLGVSNSND
jgi:hypothetical protein